MLDAEVLNIDEAVSRLRDLEAETATTKRREFASLLREGWLFHDLQLEGVSLTAGDIDRARASKEPADFCDGVLLDQIRAYDGVLGGVLQNVGKGTFPVFESLFSLANAIEPSNTADPVRTSDGATEQYKHDVAPAVDALGAARVAMSMIAGPASDGHPVEVAVEAHFALLKAWPLSRWNAAVSRLVTNQFLMLHGYPPAVIVASDREQYYQAPHYDVLRLHGVITNAIWQQLAASARFYTGDTRLLRDLIPR